MRSSRTGAPGEALPVPARTDRPRRPRRWSRMFVVAAVLTATYAGMYVALRAGGSIPFSTRNCRCGQTFVALADYADRRDAGWRGAVFAPLVAVELHWRNGAHGS